MMDKGLGLVLVHLEGKDRKRVARGLAVGKQMVFYPQGYDGFGSYVRSTQGQSKNTLWVPINLRHEFGNLAYSIKPPICF